MKQGFRKNRRDGVIFGVCAGIADQFGFDVLWTRVAFVALTLLGFGLPLLLPDRRDPRAVTQPGPARLSGAVAPARKFPKRPRAHRPRPVGPFHLGRTVKR